MPPFRKPKFEFDYVVDDEIAALQRYRDNEPGRAIPAKTDQNVLIATWNVANLGVQKRRDSDYRLIAEMMSWFDLIAVQEVNDNLEGLRSIQPHLPDTYRVLFSDASGNNERLTFIYDIRKITLMEKVGEINIPPSDIDDVKLPGISQRFQSFDRPPYIASFKASEWLFALINVHLYFGKFDTDESSLESIERRQLEAFAVARWAHLRRKSKNVYTKDILAIGDFNLPKVSSDDPIYRALTRRGLTLPKHSTEIGSSLREDNHFDQIAFFPEETEADFSGKAGVFDFDGAVFRALWNDPARSETDFFAYLRYYISDHRLLWGEFRV